MIDTAGTLVKSVDALLANGAKDVYACATHGIFSGEALDRLMASPIKSVAVTNTIAMRDDVQACPKIRTLSIAPLLSEAIRRIYTSDSISSLFV
jgi:ribose-phosphate pyrophosphokinase